MITNEADLEALIAWLAKQNIKPATETPVLIASTVLTVRGFRVIRMWEGERAIGGEPSTGSGLYLRTYVLAANLSGLPPIAPWLVESLQLQARRVVDHTTFAP